MSGERLQKLLARAGVASRREAERLILEGRVTVNGRKVTDLGTQAGPEDVVTVDGRTLVGAERLAYYLLNKPVGVVSTVRDPQGRKTVRQILAAVPLRVYPVGRLDADSEGLLLLTNDGELAQGLTHPRFGVEKEYEIRLKAAIDEAALARIRRGVQSGGDLLRPLRLQAVAGSNGTELLAVLGEGKKREIRRMFEACGREVIRLRRVRLGPLWLGSLPSGEFRELTKAEIDQLRAAISA